MRQLVTAASPPPSALAELKAWLGITTGSDDAALTTLLATALEVCGDFTGLVPLLSDWRETVEAAPRVALATRPVRAVSAVLDAAQYEVVLTADGGCLLRFDDPPIGRLAVDLSAGLADDWDALPEAIRHGVIRLAAHQYRQRESDGAAPLPPASVAALWRPWRVMRLG
jgi:uncharacterized phiE125 gp8 family phage protein